MAIVNKYLKGLFSDAERSDVYTMVVWPDANFSLTGASHTIESLTGDTGHIVPYLRVGATNANSVTDGNTYAGELLTTAFDVSLDKTWTWTTQIKAPKISAIDSDTHYLALTSGTTKLVGGERTITLNSTGVSVSGPAIFNSTVNVTGSTIFHNEVTITGSHNLDVSGAVTVGSKCEALYFNAKSDIRAKEHIKTLDKDFKQSIANLVESIIDNFYSFNFKGNNNATFGLIAQELYEKCIQNNVDPHLFMDNINATGENGDYMSINTTALLYALFIYIGELKSYGKIR